MHPLDCQHLGFEGSSTVQPMPDAACTTQDSCPSHHMDARDWQALGYQLYPLNLTYAAPERVGAHVPLHAMHDATQMSHDDAAMTLGNCC